MAWGRVALVTAATHPAAVERLVLSDLAIDPADVDAQKQGRVDAKAARADAGIAETPRIDGVSTTTTATRPGPRLPRRDTTRT